MFKSMKREDHKVQRKFAELNFDKREYINFYGEYFESRFDENLTPAKVRNDAAAKISLLRAEIKKAKKSDNQLFKQIKTKKSLNKRHALRGNRNEATTVSYELKSLESDYKRSETLKAHAHVKSVELSKELRKNNKMYKRQIKSLKLIGESDSEKELLMKRFYNEYTVTFDGLTKKLDTLSAFIKGELNAKAFEETEIGKLTAREQRKIANHYKSNLKSTQEQKEIMAAGVKGKNEKVVESYKGEMNRQKTINEGRILDILAEIEFIREERDKKITLLKEHKQNKNIKKAEVSGATKVAKTIGYDTTYFFKQFGAYSAQIFNRLTFRYSKYMANRTMTNRAVQNEQMASLQKAKSYNKDFHDAVAKNYRDASKEFMDKINKIDAQQKDFNVYNPLFNKNVKTKKLGVEADTAKFKEELSNITKSNKEKIGTIVISDKDKTKLANELFEAQNKMFTERKQLISEYKKLNVSKYQVDEFALSMLEVAVLKAEIKNNSFYEKIVAKRDIRIFRLKRRERSISRMALKNSVTKSRAEYKRGVLNSKLTNKLFKVKYDRKEARKEKWIVLKNIRKGAYNQEEYLTKQYPIEQMRGTRYMFAIVNFLLGGMAYIFARQYKKGLITLAITLCLYFLIIPFIFGVTHIAGNGIFGIGSLGKGTWLSDGRFFLVEGIYGLVLLIFVVIYVIMMAISGYRLGLILEKGMRPNTWFITKKVLDRVYLPYLLSIPSVLIVLFLTIAPLMTLGMIMFTDWGATVQPSFGEQLHYVGFQNFSTIFGGGDNVVMASISKEFWQVVGWTFIWGFVTWSIGTVLKIAIAMLMESDRIKFRTFWKTIMILPSAIPAFIMIIMFSLMVNAPLSDGASNGGPIYKLMVDMHLWSVHPAGATSGIHDPKQSVVFVKAFLILMSFWFGIGGGMMFFGGLLQGISPSLYEAAEVDGAGVWRRQRAITIPHLLFIVAPMLVPWLVQSLNNFGMIYLFNAGGPEIKDAVTGIGQTDIILSLIYKIIGGSKSAFENSYGIGAVIVVVFGLLCVGVALPGVIRSKSLRNGAN